MLVSTLIFVIISRCLERALMRKKGINHVSEYPQYLLHASDLDTTNDVYRLTSQGLKDSAEALKSQANVSDMSTRSKFAFINRAIWMSLSLFCSFFFSFFLVFKNLQI